MLDINIIREQPDLVRKALADRQDEAAPVDQILELDRRRRLTIQEGESLKAERNTVSKEIGKERPRRTPGKDRSHAPGGRPDQPAG